MELKNVMTLNVEVISPDATLEEAAQKMQRGTLERCRSATAAGWPAC